jgi:hypothetical protein
MNNVESNPYLEVDSILQAFEDDRRAEAQMLMNEEGYDIETIGRKKSDNGIADSIEKVSE